MSILLKKNFLFLYGFVSFYWFVWVGIKYFVFWLNEEIFIFKGEKEYKFLEKVKMDFCLFFYDYFF